MAIAIEKTVRWDERAKSALLETGEGGNRYPGTSYFRQMVLPWQRPHSRSMPGIFRNQRRSLIITWHQSHIKTTPQTTYRTISYMNIHAHPHPRHQHTGISYSVHWGLYTRANRTWSKNARVLSTGNSSIKYITWETHDHLNCCTQSVWQTPALFHVGNVRDRRTLLQHNKSTYGKSLVIMPNGEGQTGNRKWH